MRNQNLSEELAVVSHIAPAAARNIGSYVGGVIDGTNYGRLLAKLHIGTLTGAGTVYAKFQHASASTGPWSDVSSTLCVTSTFGSASNNRIGQLEVRTDQYSSILRFLRPYVEVAGANGWTGCVEVIGEPALKSAVHLDSPDVVQTVVY